VKKLKRGFPEGRGSDTRTSSLMTPRARMITKKRKIKRLTLKRGMGMEDMIKGFLGRKC
jgi:hypothetical protein